MHTSTNNKACCISLTNASSLGYIGDQCWTVEHWCVLNLDVVLVVFILQNCKIKHKKALPCGREIQCSLGEVRIQNVHKWVPPLENWFIVINIHIDMPPYYEILFVILENLYVKNKWFRWEAVDTVDWCLAELRSALIELGELEHAMEDVMGLLWC